MDDTKICKGKNIEFIRWFHEFSVTTNLRIFQETEFAYLILANANVNNNNHFHSLQNS
jgi:hypothetical protein